MPYTVEVEWTPMYELLTSLRAYGQFHKYGATLEVRGDWASTIKKRGGKRLVESLAAAGMVDGLDLLIRQSPQKETVQSTLQWLANLSSGEVLERLMSRFSDCASGPAHGMSPKAVKEITGMVARWGAIVELFRVWDEVYFRSVDPAILDGLRLDATEKRALAATITPEDLVEQATFGVRLDSIDADVKVLLTPQFHFRPWNTWQGGATFVAFDYPADVIPPEKGMPPQSLVRMTRALSDPSRLSILKAIASGAESFTDLFAASGLAKSTVHHHLMALRAAGLVRSHVSYPFGSGPDRYSLRPGALNSLGISLSSYLKEE